MDNCKPYESKSMRDMLGETLRPGGFTLTEKGIQFCNISKDDEVLDVGCGRGATIHHIYENLKIRGVGVDPSEKLIDIARRRQPHCNFVLGRGEILPFENESFRCVFAECTLSLMDDVDATLREIHRVLKGGGWFVVTDVFAKNTSEIANMKEFSFRSCMQGLHNLSQLQEKIRKVGFEIELLEDCSHLLKEIMVKIIFAYGSMREFWNDTTNNGIDGAKFTDILNKCKPGYFMMIARKDGVKHG